ncbi:MAG: hypothetical protein JW963_11765 [Anaerolineales bacterium]|nr:hypothetical protein [Anaerolineales bacterium]
MERTPLQQSLQAELAISPPSEWLQLFEEENVQLVILDSQLDNELVQAIRLQPEWQVDFEDDELVIFTSAKRH